MLMVEARSASIHVPCKMLQKIKSLCEACWAFQMSMSLHATTLPTVALMGHPAISLMKSEPKPEY